MNSRNWAMVTATAFLTALVAGPLTAIHGSVIGKALETWQPLIAGVGGSDRLRGDGNSRRGGNGRGGGSEMGGFRILRTNHTSFTVSDLDRSIALYAGVLGFELVHRGRRDRALIETVVGVPGADIEVAYLQAPDHRLELIQYHGPAERERFAVRPCDVGFAHIAFDVDDLDATLAAAEPAGLVALNPPQTLEHGPNAGGRLVYSRDFDGVTVEFIEKPGDRTA